MKTLTFKRTSMMTLSLVFILVLAFYAPHVFASEKQPQATPQVKETIHLQLAKGHYIPTEVRDKC